MYGMIHQALRELAIRHLDESGWNALVRESGQTGPLLIGMEYYPDETTMALIDLVAARLDMPRDDLLREFGRVWIDFAGASQYGRILRMAGDDLVSFLESLDRMHASIRSNMPMAEMPSFDLIAHDDAGMQVRYRSIRDGLAPFVEGILSAVAERFGEQVAITYMSQEGGALFLIRRGTPNG